MAFFACADSILFSPKVFQKLWSDHSPVLSIEQLLICKSPSRLSQEAYFLNRVLCQIYESTPERWGKGVTFKVKKLAKWKMDLDDFQKWHTKKLELLYRFHQFHYQRTTRLTQSTSWSRFSESIRARKYRWIGTQCLRSCKDLSKSLIQAFVVWEFGTNLVKRNTRFFSISCMSFS